MSRTKQSIMLTIAAGCMCMALVSTASAAKFTSTVTPEEVIGSGGEQIFSVGTTAIKCATVSGRTSKSSFPTEQIALGMIYASCTVTGLGTATLKCEIWSYHSTGTVSGGTDTGGTVTIGSCEMTIAGICTIRVAAQLSNGVTYVNIGFGIKVTLNISGLKYTASAGCIGFSKEGNNMGYKGELSLRGAVSKTIIAIA